jgi:hypothetical protein
METVKQVGRGGLNVKGIDYLIPLKASGVKKRPKKPKISKMKGGGKKAASTAKSTKLKTSLNKKSKSCKKIKSKK